MPDSPLDPHDEYATYRVACPACSEPVWASYSPPPEKGEDLLAGHDCPGAIEAQVEPGTNGDDVTMGEPGPPVAIEPTIDPVPIAAVDRPAAEVQLPVEDVGTTVG